MWFAERFSVQQAELAGRRIDAMLKNVVGVLD
jgi:hypothetical protein